MTIAIIQNDPLVPPGLLLEALGKTGHACHIVEAHSGEHLPLPTAVTGAVVLGGTMCALDTLEYPFLREVKGFIAQSLATGLPLLGICLGGQLMADVAGGQVARNRHQEKGVRRIHRCGPETDLFFGLDQEFISFHWHDDAFDPPPGAPVLARTAACPHQAFQAGPRAFGLQFHPEATPEIVAGWSAQTPGTEHFLTALKERWAAYRKDSLALLTNFLQRICQMDRTG